MFCIFAVRIFNDPCSLLPISWFSRQLTYVEFLKFTKKQCMIISFGELANIE